MPSIAEATRANQPSVGRRFLVGVGFVIGGALLVGLGGAGATRGMPIATGLLSAGTLGLLGLVALAMHTSIRSHERGLITAGGVLALASLLILWAIPSPVVEGNLVLTAVGALGYLAGITVVLAVMFAGVSMDSGPRELERTNSVAWMNASSRSSTREAATDGGSHDDEITFLLDDE